MGSTALSTSSGCADKYDSPELYCSTELNNGIVAAITVSAVVGALLITMLIICLVRNCCPEKEARSTIATVSDYNEIYTISSLYPKKTINKNENHSKVHKKQSSITTQTAKKKNRRLRRISDELKEHQKMSEFQSKIGSTIIGTKSAPVATNNKGISQAES